VLIDERKSKKIIADVKFDCIACTK